MSEAKKDKKRIKPHYILIGVLVFELLKIILQFLGVNPYYNYVVQGLVIVLAVSLDIRKYIAKK